MVLNHKLMHNNLRKSDMDAVRKLILKKPLILTQNRNVEEFERNGPNGLELNTQLFVNSGSSANFITISILKNLNKNKKKMK